MPLGDGNDASLLAIATNRPLALIAPTEPFVRVASPAVRAAAVAPSAVRSQIARSVTAFVSSASMLPAVVKDT